MRGRLFRAANERLRLVRTQQIDQTGKSAPGNDIHFKEMAVGSVQQCPSCTYESRDCGEVSGHALEKTCERLTKVQVVHLYPEPRTEHYEKNKKYGCPVLATHPGPAGLR